MSHKVRESVKKLVAKRISTLSTLSLDWFGGEPLVAFDVISNIAPEIQRLASEKSCRLRSHITTNGYLLTEDVANRLIEWGVQSFQITIDGPREEHNRRRVLQFGPEGTFDRIIENVKSLLSTRHLFAVTLRINYDLDSLPKIPAFLEFLASWVGDDPRVRIDFCPIWGEPGITTLSIPMGKERQRSVVDLFAIARSLSLRTSLPDWFTPGGMVCYAAKGNSLVIRSDGSLNKCTVALDADYNHVGWLREDGTLEIEIDKFAKWTNSGMDEDSVCQKCVIAPICQGNVCPLDRFENGRRPCPPIKYYPKESVLLAI